MVVMSKHRVQVESDYESDDDLVDNAPKKYLDLYNVPVGYQYAMKSGCKSFALFYFLRFGVTYVMHLVTMLRSQPRVLLRALIQNDLEKLVGEDALRGRINAVMWGQVAGSFTFIFHVVRKLVNDRLDDDKKATFAAGAVGGLSLLFWDRNSFRTLTTYVFARLLRAVWKALKNRGYVEKYLGLTDDSHLVKHGNFHVFAAASAQIMYAYGMQPSTLGRSYHQFIVRMGPVSAPGLAALCQLHNHGPAALDVEALRTGLALPSSKNFIADTLILRDVVAAATQAQPENPISTHPGHPKSIAVLLFKVFLRSGSQALPLYAALQFIPGLLLKLKAMFRSPVKIIANYIISVLRSTVFMGLFPAIYVVVPLLQMAIFPTAAPFQRWRPIFWIAGWVASLSLLFERQDRQGELALYSLSMALNCGFNTLQEAGVPGLKLLPPGLGELLLYSLSMGGLSYFHFHETDNVRSLFKTIYSRTVRSHNQKVILQPGTDSSVDQTCTTLREVNCSVNEADLSNPEHNDNLPQPLKTITPRPYESMGRRIRSLVHLAAMDVQ